MPSIQDSLAQGVPVTTNKTMRADYMRQLAFERVRLHMRSCHDVECRFCMRVRERSREARAREMLTTPAADHTSTGAVAVAATAVVTATVVTTAAAASTAATAPEEGVVDKMKHLVDGIKKSIDEAHAVRRSVKRGRLQDRLQEATALPPKRPRLSLMR